jgi:hypothetical protein
MEICRQDPEPTFRAVITGHFVACHLASGEELGSAA